MRRARIVAIFTDSLRSPIRRGVLAGALGGLALTAMFWQNHGASFNRYALNRGNKFLGYVIVWILALALGALFGKLANGHAEDDLGFALSRGLLIGLAWFVLASCLLLPPLRGTHPFSLEPPVVGELVEYLVYGLLLGMSYYQLPEFVPLPSTPPRPNGP
ncbi:MAG: hypothetical protein IVW57_02790 [Ktedonobacterales bacterium]|nr:hypothetical protein [Ktedonobacterales bacterium]